MDQKVVVALLFLTFFLVGCGGGEVQATQRTTVEKVLDTTSSTPTGATTIPELVSDDSSEDSQTAAEALKELQDSGALTTTGTVESSGSIYSGTSSDLEGKDALNEKTKQAYSTGIGIEGSDVDEDDIFGPKYYTSSGNPINLPEDYGNDDSAGE